MLTDSRAALSATIRALQLKVGEDLVDVWDRIPDDVNALPCIVVGYPSARSGLQDAVVFDGTTNVYAIARRVDAGDSEGELTVLTDALWTGLGGTRGARSSDGLHHLVVDSVTHRVVQVAGVDHDAYVVAVETPLATC